MPAPEPAEEPDETPEISPEARQAWEKAEKAVAENKTNLLRRKGVLGVHVTPKLDKNNEPTGKAEITIEVIEKLPEDKLNWNQALPKELDEVVVNVADVRGVVPIGDVATFRRERAPASRGGRRRIPKGPVALGAAAGAGVRVGSGVRVVAVEDGEEVSGWGTAAALLLDYTRRDPVTRMPGRFLLTCAHVLSRGGVTLQDASVGCLDQSNVGNPSVGKAVVFGHNSAADWVLIAMNEDAEVAGDIRIIYFLPKPPLVPNPPGSTSDIATRSNRHYFPRRLDKFDAQRGTKVYHLGAVSGGTMFGAVVGVKSDFIDRTGKSLMQRPLITIKGEGDKPFVQDGDSGGLLLTKDRNEVVGMIVGIQDDNLAVACHFLDIISFVAGTSLADGSTLSVSL